MELKGMARGPSQEDRLHTWLRAWCARRLGIAAQQVDPHAPWSRYGIESVDAVRLANELGDFLGRPLPPTILWRHPTIAGLAVSLSGEPGPEAAGAKRTAAETGEEPVAVIGLACRFPGAPSPEHFWRLLLEGQCAVREIPAQRWDAAAFYDPDPRAPGKMVTRKAAFLDRIDGFDPRFFGISPREAHEMDPQQRLMLELSWEALVDAGIPPAALRNTRTGVFTGAIWARYDRLRKHPAFINLHTGPGQAFNVIANRVSYTFGFQGPSLAVDTACSSSLLAVHLACQSLLRGESEIALAGGVNLILEPWTMVELSKFGGLSPHGCCHAFAAEADGFGRGEGGGIVVLKRLSQALADGDPIYCTVRGSAVNNDGPSNGLTAPHQPAQEAVLREAYRRAGVAPSAVGYVEAHGTGTALGDPIEAAALAAVFGEGRPAQEPLRIGSVKTNVGHLEGAAGIAGLIKTALVLRHRMLPPSLHFERPNPHIPFDRLPLQVQTAAEPWPGPERPAAAGVSSFGWGGTNSASTAVPNSEPMAVWRSWPSPPTSCAS